MEDDRIQLMFWRAILTMILLAMIGSTSDGVICPAACRCENDVLKTSCASASLEFVPIQLNPELQELDLSHNKIVQIHFSFHFYERLVALNLSFNKIKSLGSSNFNLQKNLTLLNLSSNLIGTISKDSLKGLKALTHLDLSNNALEEINPVAFRELHSLISLKLCGNRLGHLEESLFRTSRNLKELLLNDNQFLEVPTIALVDTVHLMHLSLSRNLILSISEGDFPNLPELHTLLLDNNVITDIDPTALSTLPLLDHLDLSDNNLTTVPSKPLAKLANLGSLKLSGNFIEHMLPVAFRGLFHLRILRIDRLEILKQVDIRAFVDNINLEKVYMDNNVRMENLPTRIFHGNPKIKFVSVRYNNFKTLEATNFPLDHLHELRLGGNPFQCNCSLSWLWYLIKEQKSKFPKMNHTIIHSERKVASDFVIDDQDIICDGPEELTNVPLSAASQSQIECSMNWISALSVAITLALIIGVIGGVVYWAPKMKSRNSKTSLPAESTIVKNMSPPILPRKSEMYNHPPHLPDRYVFQQPKMLQEEYHFLPTWDAYCSSGVNIYEQLNDNVDRPHIVYV